MKIELTTELIEAIVELGCIVESNHLGQTISTNRRRKYYTDRAKENSRYDGMTGPLSPDPYDGDPPEPLTIHEQDRRWILKSFNDYYKSLDIEELGREYLDLTGKVFKAIDKSNQLRNALMKLGYFDGDL